MGSIKHGHVLHVLISVPWVRLDDVKAVVHDDPADPVILGLGAVILVALSSVVQDSSAYLTNKQARWLYIYKKKITWPLHSCIAMASSFLNCLINFHRFGIRGASLFNALFHPSTAQLVCGCNNAANHTPKLGVEPGLDPLVTARVKVASVEGLDVVDPLVGSLTDVFLIAFEECVDACVGKQSDVVVMNSFSQFQPSKNF